MTLLTWRVASNDDRPALQGFRCTPKPKKTPFSNHPVPDGLDYEREAQAHIRTHKPAGNSQATTLVGVDKSGIFGAVVRYSAIDRSSAQVLLEVIAVRLDLRHRGGGVAREALGAALDYMTGDAWADGHSAATVLAKIHEDNRPSQALFAQSGFRQTDEDGEYQLWTVDLILEGAE